jgi:regulation of enolase protein 1 (concanavalin A-like superfamily)
LFQGVEYVDGEYQLSVVVTNGHSDWSVQRVPTGNLSVRMFRQDNDFIVSIG